MEIVRRNVGRHCIIVSYC